MTWKFAGYENTTPSIPLYEFGETFDFRMSFVNDTDTAFSNGYLYCNPEHIGMLQIKRVSEPESAYRDVRGCLDANAFLGTVPVGETEIDIRMNNSIVSGNINLYIQVFAAHDDGAKLPVVGFLRSYSRLWKTCYDHVQFFRKDYSPDSIDESVCSRRVSASEGFAETSEPQQFEDSNEPGAWS